MKSTRCPQARWRVTAACGLAVAVAIPAAGSIAAPVPSRAECRPEAIAVSAPSQANPSFGSLPISFEPNVGQGPAGVRFLTRGSAATLTATGAVLEGGATPVTLEFIGASASARMTATDELPGKANYLVGNDPSAWTTNVPTYSSVRVEQMYESVDLVWYGKDRSLEYDLVLAAGVDPGVVSFTLNGALVPHVEPDGALVAGDVRLERPVAYQEIDGMHRTVPCSYFTSNDGCVGFRLGECDRSLPLVIDPEIGYTFAFAESTKDITVSGVAVDATGAAYVVGSTKPAGTGVRDILVSKLNPDGTALVYSTTIGGARDDQAFDVAVDASGNVFVTGETTSSDFPATAGAFQTAFASANANDPDAFVLKLAPDGDTLAYATYLGGGKFDHGKDIVIDGPGNAYVVGTTTSTNFPTTEPEQAGNGGLADAFVTIVNPTGNARVRSTYLGGSESENGEGIAIDPAGNVHVVGATFSQNFPVTAGALQSAFGGGIIDAFWAKYGPTGQRVASTYLGSTGNDLVRAVAVDSAGNSYLTGEAGADDFPLVSPVQSTFAGANDVFVSRLDSAGAALSFSTLYGGTEYEAGFSIAVDRAGRVVVVGETYSTNFPTVDPVQPTFGGGLSDAFALLIDIGGLSATRGQGEAQVVFGTTLGGVRAEFGSDCAVGPDNGIIVASNSPDLSQNGQENDEGDVSQLELEPAVPLPDLEVSIQFVSFFTYEGISSAIVPVYVRSTANCGLESPAAPNATFQLEVPAGLGVYEAVPDGDGVSVVSKPERGQPGIVVFKLNRRLNFTANEGGLVLVAAQSGLPPPGLAELRASAFTTADDECSYSNNATTALLDIQQRVFRPGARLLEITLDVVLSAPPAILLVNDAAPGIAPPEATRTAGAVRGLNVYTSTQAGVQTVPANLFASLPPGQTSLDVSTSPGGSFFVVTTVTDDGESPPSNEVGGVLPTVTKLKVSATKIVAQGTGFAPGVRVLFGGLPFANAASLKKNNTRLIQKGLLISGQTIGAFTSGFLEPGSKVVILIVNANGNAVAVEYTR